MLLKNRTFFAIELMDSDSANISLEIRKPEEYDFNPDIIHDKKI